MPKIAPYGTWSSPITPEFFQQESYKFTTVLIQDGSLYWDETRGHEKGRTAVMERTSEGVIIERTPSFMSCKTKVHEYGGKCFAISDKKLYFVNETDQRVYCENTPITPPGTRCADFFITVNTLIGVGQREEENFLFALDLTSQVLTIIASGHDFYASPALSPCGTKLAYLTWDHPHMPWDSTYLWLAQLEKGVLSKTQLIAGGESVSVQQPVWSPDGNLYCITDTSNFWNLYRYDQEKWSPVLQEEKELGVPLWQLGISSYCLCHDTLIGACQANGIFTLKDLQLNQPIHLPWSFYTQIRGEGSLLACIAGSKTEGKAVICHDFTTKTTTVIRRESSFSLAKEAISLPENFTFYSANNRICHAIYYPPTHPQYIGCDNTKPPLMVMSHGGPTSQAFPLFDLKIQFWTSRGFAVVDVNYTGSCGYGRNYRLDLYQNWGIYDVQDCQAAAYHLIHLQQVNPDCIAIRGSSAGGYTTLTALLSPTPFTVGASYYGVSDLSLLTQETHKFEKHYLDQLVGPYLENPSVYENRSPLYQTHRLRCPVIFFQGEQDKIVPPNQAQLMHQALEEKKIQTQLIMYANEQHGFKDSLNIQDALFKELEFYLNVWNII